MAANSARQTKRIFHYDADLLLYRHKYVIVKRLRKECLDPEKVLDYWRVLLTMVLPTPAPSDL